MTAPESPHADQMKSKAGLGRVFKAFKYSMQGLSAAWREEHAFRQEIFAFAPLLVMAAILDVPASHKAMLIGSILLIFIIELINSSIEAAVDLVTKDHAPLAGKAKDLGSAAVFLGMVNAAVVWALILYSNFADCALN